MNISEILVTVGLTVTAGAIIAYTTFKLQVRHREKALFRALRSEIELNKLKLETFIEDWSMYYWEKTDYCPEAPILFTEAYEALRLSGEILKLPENVRNRLSNTVSLIAIHNLRMSEAGLDYVLVKGEISKTEGRMNGILKNLRVMENEIGKGVQKPSKGSDYEQESLLPRYIMLQVSLFFSFGLLSIYAYYLGELDISANMSIWDWVQYGTRFALVAIGIGSIAWAIILSIVGLNCKVPGILKGVRERITRFIRDGRDRPIVYVVSLAVFATSFITTWGELSSTEIGVVYRDILLGIALALTGVFVVDNIRSARHRGEDEKEE